MAREHMRTGGFVMDAGAFLARQTRVARLTAPASAALFSVAAIAAAYGILAHDDESAILLSNAALVAVIGILVSANQRLRRDHPFRFVSFVLLVTAIQPMSLMAVVLLGGTLEYVTELGLQSHAANAHRVALVYGLFCTAMVIAAALVPRPRMPPGISWAGLMNRLDDPAVRGLGWVALGAAAVRVILAFPEPELPEPVLYVFRIFFAYCSVATFFLGVGARRQLRGAWLLTFIVGGIYALNLLAGNRWESLLPGVCWLAGYFVGVELTALQRATLGIALVAVGSAATYVGEIARSDQRGRSGAAAIERLNEVDDRLLATGRKEDAATALFIRFLRTGTHAVISATPEHHAFDESGIAGLFSQFAERFLPRLTFSGQSDDLLPRNAVLRDFGFRITWGTSVELALVPDAWFRGGWPALVLLAVIAGLVLQLSENALYSVARRVTTYVPLFIFCVVPLLMFEGRDLVHGVRSLVLNLAVTAAVLGVVELSRRMRWGPARFHRIHGPRQPS